VQDSRSASVRSPRQSRRKASVQRPSARMAEKEELFGKGLILTVIPETLVIFGLVIAILIIGMAG